MRGHPFNSAAAICLVAAFVVWSPSSAALEAGSAKIDLALEPGIPLDGDFTRRGRSAATVHDPLYVRALYLEENGVACFLVVADLFAITPDLRARVLELAPSVVSPENVILAATHTRSGPGGLDRSWLARHRGGRFVPELVDAVATKTAEAMQLAYDSRKRGAIGYAAGSIPLGMDRFASQAAADGHVTVLRVDDSDGNPIAVAANFAAAADLAARVDSFALSADIPGAFCDSLEATSPPGAVAFFFNGESADRVAVSTGTPVDWSTVQSIGETLAARVKALANGITCRVLPITVASGVNDIPRGLMPEFFPPEITMHVLEVDKLAMLFSPAVTFAESGAEMRGAAQRAGYSHVMVVGPADGYIGAAATPARYDFVAGGGDPVYLDPAAAELLAERAVSLLSQADESTDSQPVEQDVEATPVIAGIARYTEIGGSETAGRARGWSLAEVVPQGIAGAVEFEWLRDAPTSDLLGHWGMLHRVVDDEALLLAFASDDARRILAALPDRSHEKLAHMANAAGIEFQRLWLAQFAPAGRDADHYVSAVSALFSAAESPEGLLVGQAIGWPVDVPIAVTQASPRGGRAYVSVGLPWQLTGMCGVNDRGVVLASVPTARATDRPLSAPVETLFDEVLAHSGSIQDAMDLLLVPREGIAGRVLLGSDDGESSQSVIVEVGASPVALDMVTTDVVQRDAAAPRAAEARIARLLRGLNAATATDFELIASDRDRRADIEDRVLSPTTRACVVLVPRSREVRVMAPSHGEPREFERIRVGGEGS